MAVSIKVRYTRSEIESGLQSYDLKIEVVEATGMPKEIFVMQQVPLPNGSLDNADQFVCIADPVDLEEYPVNAPNLDAEKPYYRVSSIILRFRSFLELQSTYNLIREDIQHLVTSLNLANAFPVVQEETYE